MQANGLGAMSALFGFGRAAQVSPTKGEGNLEGGSRGEDDYESDASDSGLEDKWGQPILQPPPAMLMPGSKEIANFEPPPGLF